MNLTAIFEAIKALFGFGQKVAENKSIRLENSPEFLKAKDELKAERKDIKKDKIQDREQRTEPKKLIEFNSFEAYNQRLRVRDVLYYGERDRLLRLIKTDSANVLTRGQYKVLRKQIKQSPFKYFIIIIDPLTQHT